MLGGFEVATRPELRIQFDELGGVRDFGGGNSARSQVRDKLGALVFTRPFAESLVDRILGCTASGPGFERRVHRPVGIAEHRAQPFGDFAGALAAVAGVQQLVGGQGALVRVPLAAGTLVIFAGGVAQLWMLTGQDLSAAVAMGVTPFLVGAVVKILLAWLILTAYRAARRGSS